MFSFLQPFHKKFIIFNPLLPTKSLYLTLIFMDLRDLFGYLFILAGLLQLLTAYLIFAGQRHYVLRFANRKVGSIIYVIFAFVLFYLAYYFLV